MKISINAAQKIYVGLAIVGCVMIGLNYLLYLQYKELSTSRMWRLHSYAILNLLHETKEHIQLADIIAIRSVKEGRPIAIFELRNLARQTQKLRSRLQTLIQDNPFQQKESILLETLIDDLFQTLLSEGQPGEEAIFKEILISLNVMQEMENQLLAFHKEQSHYYLVRVWRVILSLIILGFLLLVGVSCLVRKMITGQRSLNGELARSLRTAQDLYDRAPCGYHSMDNDGYIVIINNTELAWLNRGRSEVIGKKFSDFLTEESRERFEKLLPELRIGGHGQIELELDRVNLPPLPVEVDLSGLCDLENRQFRIRATLSDNSERKKAQEDLLQLMEQLRQKNSELTNFSHVVAHDLKGPLVVIHSIVRMIGRDLGDNPNNVAHLLQDLQNQLKSGFALIDGILHYSKVGSIRESDISRVSVNDIVENVLAALPANVEVDVSPELGQINAEPIKIHQVFQNLIGNAIKYSDKENPKISVGMFQQDNELVYFVKDNGPGLDAKDCERIFNLFETGRNSKNDATGIGLAIVKKIAESYEGRTWVESAPDRGGCTFFIAFPISLSEVLGETATSRRLQNEWALQS